MVSIPGFLKKEESLTRALDKLSHFVHNIVLVDGDGASTLSWDVNFSICEVHQLTSLIIPIAVDRDLHGP